MSQKHQRSTRSRSAVPEAVQLPFSCTPCTIDCTKCTKDTIHFCITCYFVWFSQNPLDYPPKCDILYLTIDRQAIHQSMTAWQPVNYHLQSRSERLQHEKHQKPPCNPCTLTISCIDSVRPVQRNKTDREREAAASYAWLLAKSVTPCAAFVTANAETISTHRASKTHQPRWELHRPLHESKWVWKTQVGRKKNLCHSLLKWKERGRVQCIRYTGIVCM